MNFICRSSVVDFNSPRGGISMETTKSEQGTVSKLVITKATSTDAGNYTCLASNAGAASVMVHVVNGNNFLLLNFLQIVITQVHIFSLKTFLF